MSFTESMISPIGAGIGQTVTPYAQAAVSGFLPEISAPAPLAVTNRRQAVIRARLALSQPAKPLGKGWRLLLGCVGVAAGAAGAYAIFHGRFGRGRRHARHASKRLK